MTDEQFKALCNTYGFAPSRALRELIDCVRAQEIEACAKAVEIFDKTFQTGGGIAGSIRARKENQ